MGTQRSDAARTPGQQQVVDPYVPGHGGVPTNHGGCGNHGGGVPS